MNQSKKMTKLAIAALEDKKANDVRVIDIAGVSVIADYFVFCKRFHTNQVQAWLTASVSPWNSRLWASPDRRLWRR